MLLDLVTKPKYFLYCFDNTKMAKYVTVEHKTSHKDRFQAIIK